jgi:hypothetical protein
MMMSSANTVGRATSATARRTRSRALTGSGPSSGSPMRCTMASTTTTAPSTMTPKSTAPIDKRFAAMPRACR